MMIFDMTLQKSADPGLDYLLGLTLHAPDNTRLMGFDNAHSVKPSGSHFKHAGKQYPYDRRHRHISDEGVLYPFDNGY